MADGMADRKRKVTEATDSTKQKMKFNKKRKRHPNKISGGGGVGVGDDKRERRGPRLPSSMRKELDRMNSDTNSLNGSDEDIDFDEARDFYEYEEALPQEESKKNRRFDPVENYEYELPKKFKDENVLSDDDDGENDDGVNKIENNRGSDEIEDEDDERHMRMLQGTTGMLTAAFEGKKKKKNLVISKAYPESEFNPSCDVLDGNGQGTVEDLLEPVRGKPGYSKLRKRMHQMHKKLTSAPVPLPKAEREKLERQAVYEQSK